MKKILLITLLLISVTSFSQTLRGVSMRLPYNVFCESIQTVGFEKLNDSVFNGYIKGVPVELYVNDYKDSIHYPSNVVIESEPYSNFDMLCQTITKFESYIIKMHGAPFLKEWTYKNPSYIKCGNEMEYLNDNIIHYYSVWKFTSYEIWVVTESLANDDSYVVICFKLHSK